MSLKQLAANNSDIVAAVMKERGLSSKFTDDSSSDRSHGEFIPYAEAISIPIEYRILSFIRSFLMKNKSDV